MEKKILQIDSDYITLGQVLKLENLIETGGMAKWYLQEFDVYVNEELEDRRGRKLYTGDHVYFVEEDLSLTIQTVD